MHARVFELNQYCTDPVKLAERERVLGPIKKKGKKNE